MASQYTDYTAMVQVATGQSVPKIKALRVALTKLAKTVPADAEISLEAYTYGFVENGPKYRATRLVAKWSRYE